MIDIETDELITLTQAARLLPKVRSKYMHTSTLWRWCSKGNSGIKLQYVRLGRRIFTTAKALSEFSKELSEQDTLGVPPETKKQIIKRSKKTIENDKLASDLCDKFGI